MTFKLEINCDNVAFRDGEHLDEVARILNQAYTSLMCGKETKQLCDINGNVVGQYAFKGKQPK